MTGVLKQREPVLVLAGYIAKTLKDDGSEITELRFSDNAAIEIPAEFCEFLMFMQIPRLESEVFLWLEEHCMSRATPRRLIRDWWLVSVPPGSYSKALAAFRGLRIVPTCYIQKPSERFDDFHYVTNEERAPYIERVSPLLGGAMWDSPKDEDLISSANRLGVPDAHRLSPPTPYTVDQKAAMTLVNLHMLLENNYVRLERAEQLREPKSLWISRLLGKNK